MENPCPYASLFGVAITKLMRWVTTVHAVIMNTAWTNPTTTWFSGKV